MSNLREEVVIPYNKTMSGASDRGLQPRHIAQSCSDVQQYMLILVHNNYYSIA